MRIPRWTTYPAFALLLMVAISALPRRAEREEEGAAAQARARAIRGADGSSSILAGHRGQAQCLSDFLPPGHVTDGSVDYRAEAQRAVDAAQSGTLVLPDFPVRVGAAPGQRYCLIIHRGMTITGSPASTLVAGEPAVQVLRAEGAEGLVLRGFRVQGVGTGGADLGHGLIQVTGGRNVQLDGLTVVGADADGIAVSGVDTCTVEGCLVEGASKAGIYLSSCTNAVVRGNIVRSFGGHLCGERPVGAGIQLSSNENLVCSDNVVTDGVGIGILCNAHRDGSPPRGNILRGNRIASVANSSNESVSGGIRCTNGSEQRATGTLIASNSLRDCGGAGIYIENHGASALIGNLIVESSGIVISTIQDLQVLDNVILGRMGAREAAPAILRINSPEGVQVEGNVIRESRLLGETAPTDRR